MIPKFVVMTSDNYIEGIKPYLWLFNKYWASNEDVEVVIAGFSSPKFSIPDYSKRANVKAKWHSIGEFGKYPLDKWSNSLIDLLDQLDDDFIILMLEDYWVIRDINVPAVKLASEYMHNKPRTLKFDLAADRFFAGGAQRDYEHYGWLDIVKSKPGSPYHMSLMTGMWNVSLLQRVLKKDWNPWDVEIDGTTHLSKNFPELDVVGSGQWPIKHTLGFRAGDSSKLLLEELQQSDVYTMKQLGLFKKWGM